MTSERTPAEERPADAAGNPYAAPDIELSDLPSDVEIADAVSVHDRYPLLSKAVATTSRSMRGVGTWTAPAVHGPGIGRRCCSISTG